MGPLSCYGLSKGRDSHGTKCVLLLEICMLEKHLESHSDEMKVA